MSGYAHFSPTFIRSGSVKVKPLRRNNINLNRAALIMVGNPSVLHHIDLDKRVVVVYERLGAAPPPQLRKKPLCMPRIVMCFPRDANDIIPRFRPDEERIRPFSQNGVPRYLPGQNRWIDTEPETVV